MSISSSCCINSTTHFFPIHNHPSKFTLLKPFSDSTLIPIAKPTNPNLSSSKLGIKCVNANQNYDPTIEDCTEKRIPRWQKLVSNAASLYPVYVSVGGYRMLKTFNFLMVTLIARGDVPLSIVMTMCTTIAAVLITPLLTKYLAGTCVPVDVIQLSISTLQVVVAPIFLGSFFQNTVPAAVRVVTPCVPLFAVLTSSLLACSVFSENVVRLKSMISATRTSYAFNLDPNLRWKAIISNELGITILSVLLLHSAGFLLGYVYSSICGFREPQRRAISIEVGM